MKTVLWILIGLIVIGLIAFLAFGVNDADDMDTPGEVATTTDAAIDRAQVRADAAADLAALEARARAGEAYEDLADEYAQVRARVAAAYENAEGEVADEWEQLEASFDEFEASARAGTSAFLAGFADLMTRLSADVRVDEESE